MCYYHCRFPENKCVFHKKNMSTYQVPANGSECMFQICHYRWVHPVLGHHDHDFHLHHLRHHDHDEYFEQVPRKSIGSIDANNKLGALPLACYSNWHQHIPDERCKKDDRHKDNYQRMISVIFVQFWGHCLCLTNQQSVVYIKLYWWNIQYFKKIFKK